MMSHRLKLLQHSFYCCLRRNFAAKSAKFSLKSGRNFMTTTTAVAESTSSKMGVTLNSTSENGKKNAQIRSLAIFDLETTGLYTNSAQVTEMAVVAVTRENFLNAIPTKETATRNGGISFIGMPRALAKICLPIEPTIAVEYKAAQISGLNKSVLKDCNDFKSAFNAFCSFLSRLPPPVCLIAHNGRRFDFVLLKNELKRNQMAMPEGIFCFDTMISLPNLHKSYLSSLNGDNKVENKKRNRKSIENEQANDKVQENDVEPEIDNLREKIDNLHESSRTMTSSSSFGPVYKYTIDRGNDVIETWSTPPAPSRSPVLEMMDQSPKNQEKIMITMQNQSIQSISVVESHSSRSAKRNLFESSTLITENGQNFTELKAQASSTTTIDQQKILAEKVDECPAKIHILKYGPPSGKGLNVIYEHFFDEKPRNAHAADGDCETLLKILLQYGKDVVELIDSEAVSF